MCPRHGPPKRDRRGLVYKKRLLSRKVKKKKIKIVARRGQPQVKAKVRVLREQEMGGSVASSWIANLEWVAGIVIMILLNGYKYRVYVPWGVWQQWYYALSKGTFFNQRVKNKYKIERI